MPKIAVVPKLKIMVASTIYGFEDQLVQICSVLQGFGYEVWNSHFKTIPVNPGLSNQGNCIQAVSECDIFLGIIRPQYGAIIDGDISITHHEMRKALELRKPRWFVAHRDIMIARQLLRQYMYNDNDDPNLNFTYKKTAVLDSIKVIQLYNETILQAIPPADRIGHWVDEYTGLGDILKCLETQLGDESRVRKIVSQMNP